MTKYSAEQLIIQDIISRNVGTAMLELRTYFGLSQREVAAEAEGLQSKVSAIEIGKRQPTLTSIATLLMGIGAAKVRKEICDDECPCRVAARNHTAEENGT